MMRDEIGDGELTTYYRRLPIEELLICSRLYAQPRRLFGSQANADRQRRTRIINGLLRERGVKYDIDDDHRTITCLTCGLTSFNANDVAQRYCGHCHVFHDDGARR